MRRIVRLTESDLTRIVRRVIMEQTVEMPKISVALDTPVSFSTITGYKSSLLNTVEVEVLDKQLTITFTITKRFGEMTNQYDHGYGYGEIRYMITYGASAKKTPPTTREEVSTLVQTIYADGNIPNGYGGVPTRSDCMYKTCKPYSIAAGGTTTNSKGQKVSWGNPGKYLGTELTDAICKIIGIG